MVYILESSYLMMGRLVPVTDPAVTIGGRTRGCWAARAPGLGCLVTSVLCGLRLAPGLLGRAEAAQLVDDIEDGVSIGGELDTGPRVSSGASVQLKLECPRTNFSLRLKQDQV